RDELTGWRIDFTQDKLFTLSKGTHSVIAKVEEPITMRFYFSSALGKEIPALAKYAQRVRDMLGEYSALSNGRIRVEYYDPVAFSDAEDQAVAAGLHGIPLDRTGEQVYFGLSAVNSTDDQETIPFFSPDREQFLEYDLSKAVQSLAQPKRKMVGIMSPLPIQGFPGTMMARINPRLAQPWAMIAQLRQIFDLKLVDTTATEIPDDVDLLMVVHPAGFTDKTMYAIDQFMLRGGRALIFVDPLSEAAEQMVGPGAKQIPTSSDLKPLFDAWGIQYDDTKVAGDIPAARRVNAGTDTRPVPVEYPAWLALKKQNAAADQPITSEIETLNMASAGAISLKPNAKVSMTPLVTTSGQSMLMDDEKLRGKPDFFGLLRDFKPGGTPLVLAARVTGEVPTAFPDGQPKDEPKKDDDKKADAAKPAAPANDDKKAEEAKPLTHPHLAKSNGPINAIIITDSDMLQDRFWVSMQDVFGQGISIPISNNMDLVSNSLDYLSGSEDLIGLRARGVSQRPFERVVALQREAEVRLRNKEQELQKQREDTERKLMELQRPAQYGADAPNTPGSVILTPAQVEEINRFKNELLRIRRELRAVQLELRQDIQSLQTRLWFYDIALVPLLVALIAIGIGFVRIRHRRRKSLVEAKG
ncbi:MAG TPA: Gldg family protein, partial [Alphaproteobacteria bacterium]|nr:Gldg family protein [Alphaproteobacteria bacterium]